MTFIIIVFLICLFFSPLWLSLCHDAYVGMIRRKKETEIERGDLADAQLQRLKKELFAKEEMARLSIESTQRLNQLYRLQEHILRDSQAQAEHVALQDNSVSSRPYFGPDF